MDSVVRGTYKRFKFATLNVSAKSAEAYPAKQQEARGVVHRVRVESQRHLIRLFPASHAVPAQRPRRRPSPYVPLSKGAREKRVGNAFTLSPMHQGHNHG